MSETVVVADIRLPVGVLMSVACPTCGADPSQRCAAGWRGRVSPGQSHAARAYLAQRTVQEVDVPGTCSSCQAPLWWVLTEGGRRMPLDPDPTPQGNVIVTGQDARPPVVKVLGGSPLAQARASGRDMYTSHFATCPSAEQRRDRRRR